MVGKQPAGGQAKSKSAAPNNIGEEIELFVNQIDALAETLPLAAASIQEVRSSSNQQLVKFLREECKVIKKKGPLLLAFLVFSPQAEIGKPVLAQAPSQITTRDREFAQLMLSQVHEVLKKNYYDPTFHGVDIDDRYKKYADQIGTANSIQSAYRMIEAYLVGLNDSHTIFIPPSNSKHVTYGFRLKMIGDKCFITHLRPGSDAEQKLHPGDQVVSLDGYGLHRDDLWQLEYYLDYLPPRLTTDFTLCDASGNVRQESVKAEFQSGQAWMPSSRALSRMEMERWQHANRSRSAEAGDVFLWKLASFNEDEGNLSHMFGEARKHRALVLDLRQNSGGSLENLIFVLGCLFDHDVTIATEVMRKTKKQIVAKSSGRYAFTGRLIILIDSRSGSASEVVARVVQLEHRGIVVGDRSSGGVMTAQYFPQWTGAGLAIPYGVQVSIADLVMTDGKSLEHVGVTPDDIILPMGIDLAAGSDPVLAHAAGLAGVKIDPTSAGKLFPFEWPSDK